MLYFLKYDLYYEFYLLPFIKMNLKKILPLFSYIFHPLFISIYAVLIYFYYSDNFFEYRTIYGVVIQILIITVFIPVTFYYLLLSFGKVDSIMLAKTAQRKSPLMIHAVLLMILVQKSIRIDNVIELHYFFLGSLISTFLALGMVFLRFKVSLHMVGITALTLFAMGISWHFQARMIAEISGLILISGLVASSRLYMKAHTNQELFYGSLIGTLPQLFLFYYWL